jgi:hypothetical protein
MVSGDIMNFLSEGVIWQQKKDRTNVTTHYLDGPFSGLPFFYKF